jgi:hypothetical protein
MAKKKPLPLRRDDDKPEMTEAIGLFESEGGKVTRPSPHHLKCGAINYWPSTGKIYLDNEEPIKERGLAALRDAIRRRREFLLDLSPVC